MTYFERNEEVLIELNRDANALEQRMIPVLKDMSVFVKERLDTKASVEAVGFSYNASKQELHIEYSWPQDNGTDLITLTREDLMSEFPGVSARLRAIEERRAARDEATRHELERARRRVTELEASLGI